VRRGGRFGGWRRFVAHSSLYLALLPRALATG
jgi:hypothetical protein